MKTFDHAYDHERMMIAAIKLLEAKSRVEFEYARQTPTGYSRVSWEEQNPTHAVPWTGWEPT